MAKRELVEVNKHQNETVDCLCRECKRRTKHAVVVDLVHSGVSRPSWDPDEEVSWTNEYQIVRCKGCETVAFRHASGNSQEGPVEVAPGEWEDTVHEDVFPNPSTGRALIESWELLPDKVLRIYQETIGSLNARHEVLCGIGIRAIIETICKDKSAQGRDLQKKIDNLVVLGVLTNDGATILHKLRTLGNKAAHDVKPHSIKELSLALEVVEHLIRGVYILPEHSKKTFV